MCHHLPGDTNARPLSGNREGCDLLSGPVVTLVTFSVPKEGGGLMSGVITEKSPVIET